ncbi:hypothetical protein K1T71_003425 [Dendrolimus kikuchii]|uniref:Uncharacterized protein n=1 Tax=Dendrolimus kikuchii TaxID=765133 RepID=A0ACC1DBY8_9NEOP|nr:hypothetical protein K1T71_003425 [Dendrolimus kikuchii]
MDYFSGWCKSNRALHGCTVVVTGCNTGIGKETAKDLYARGARVIMACRDVNKAVVAKADIEKDKETVNGTGEIVIEKLDLCSFKSVKDFALKLLSREEKINILINNAGVMMCPENKTEDGFETHIGSNHFSHALLTLLLLPRMIISAPSRILFVSSYLHERFELDLEDINFDKTPYDPYKAYCRSKAANILFAKALANKLKEHDVTNVTTYSLHPGVIRTDIGRHFDKTVWYGASWAFNNLLGLFLKSPQCGAQTTIYCAVDEDCADESGLYYCDCAVKNPSKQCQSDDEAGKLWEITLKSIKINTKTYNPFGQLDPTKESFIL